MTDRIEPALSAEEWAGRIVTPAEGGTPGAGWWGELAGLPSAPGTPLPTQRLPALIALANDALKDGDRRKITRSRIQAVIDAAKFADEYAALDFAEALLTYLPPEGT